MCTVVSFKTKDHYFGRNLDYEFSYGEHITICPRKFPFVYKTMPKEEYHYAIIGMAHIADGVPLFYEGTNEKGLSIAGLNYPDNAFYGEEQKGKLNLAPYELIPWILGKCENVAEAREELEQVQIIARPFREDFPLSPLHWMISDREASIVAEPDRDGLKIYENPAGVLTNNPPFPVQMFTLNNYRSLSAKQPENLFSKKLDTKNYSRGMGALGLPGDLSSNSRFVRAAFVKLNSVSGEKEGESVSQFFHILGSVEQQRGCVEVAPGKYEITIYSCCCNTDKGIYYYKTYDDWRIRSVQMSEEIMCGAALNTVPLQAEEMSGN